MTTTGMTMAGTSQKRAYATRTPAGQYRARKTLIRKAIAERKTSVETAEMLCISEWALRAWIQRNMPEAKGRFADKRGRPKLPVAERERRLRMVVGFTQVEAAKRLGISPPALCEWLQVNAPKGAAAALLDCIPETNYTAPHE